MSKHHLYAVHRGALCRTSCRRGLGLSGHVGVLRASRGDAGGNDVHPLDDLEGSAFCCRNVADDAEREVSRSPSGTFPISLSQLLCVEDCGESVTLDPRDADRSDPDAGALDDDVSKLVKLSSRAIDRSDEDE